MAARWLLLPLVLGSACAHLPEAAPQPLLPLKTVRLYETGIGYFERTGTAAPGDGLGLPVPASHVDDALKTLVVLGAGQRPLVRAIEFPTHVSEGMARSLARLPPSGTDLDLKEILASLRGAEVEVATRSERLRGRLVEVGERAAQGTEPARPTLLLFTERSQLRAVDSAEVEGVTPTDPARVARLASALDALHSPARAQRLMQVVAESTGPVTLGYVAEAPLWRVTYRLVLEDAGRRGVLQAWALLHNDTEEDWSKVKVELVNGRPDSFLFPLAAPRYGRRPLAHPESDLPTVPQLLGRTPDSLWGDFDEEVGESVGIGGLGSRGTGAGGGGFAHITADSAVVTGGPQASTELGVGNLAEVAQAAGTESGALFTYVLPAPLDLRSRGSALVPFLQSPVEVEALAWVEAAGEPARSGVRLRNTTGQTLPAGPLAAFSDGGLAGESGLPRLKPAQQQILRYGLDPDVEVRVEPGTLKVSESPRRLTYVRDVLQEHYLKKTGVTYRVENRSGQPRSVYVGLPVVENARVTGADALDFQDQKAVAVFRVAANSRSDRRLEFEEGLSRTVLASVEVLAPLAANPDLPEAERKVAAEALAAQRQVAESDAALRKVQAEASKLEKDLARYQGHLKALAEKGGSANPFVQRIVAAEDRLEALRRQGEELSASLEGRRAAVVGILRRLGRAP